MTSAPLGTVVCHLRRLAAGADAPSRSDRQLLHDFAAHGDQAAFETLVQRHGPLVMNVCRHVLGHEQDAEDAFQATFLALAQKASSLHQVEALAGWLHRVASHTALRARRGAARRRAREARAKVPPRPAWDEAWREVQAVLAEEVERLPEKYRVVFILCYLEDHTRAEAAGLLDLKEGTVYSRLAEAKRRLRQRLARRGLDLSAVLVATCLARAASAAAVTATLVRATVRAATAGPLPAGVPPRLLGLPRSARLFRNIAAVLLAAVGLVVAGAGTLLNREAAAGPPRQARPEPPKPAERPKPEAAIVERGDTVTVSGRVLGPDGKPFVGANAYLVFSTQRPVKHKVRTSSGADGRFRFTYSKREDTAEVWINARGNYWRMFEVMVAAPGHGPASVWIPDIKGDLTLRLVKADVPIKGRVLDLQGRPVAGATVRVLGHVWATLLDPVTTDKDGRFRVTGIGRDSSVELRVSAPSIEVKRVTVSTKPPAAGNPRDGVPVDVVVGPTKVIEGTVRARDTGKPLAGVVVYSKHSDFNTINNDEYGPKAVTDTKGRYRLVGLPKAGKYELAVYPPVEQGYLVAAKWLADTEGLKPIAGDFDLRRGIPVRLRLIDKQTRKPVRGHVQYTLAASNPLWGEAVSPYNPALILPPRVWFDFHATDKDGVIQFVAYPGHGAFFVWASTIGPSYRKARLDPADEKMGYYPLGKGEPNNGFLVGANAYRVLDTDKTDKVQPFDIELTPERPAQKEGKP